MTRSGPRRAVVSATQIPGTWIGAYYELEKWNCLLSCGHEQTSQTSRLPKSMTCAVCGLRAKQETEP